MSELKADFRCCATQWWEQPREGVLRDATSWPSHGQSGDDRLRNIPDRHRDRAESQFALFPAGGVPVLHNLRKLTAQRRGVGDGVHGKALEFVAQVPVNLIGASEGKERLA